MDEREAYIKALHDCYCEAKQDNDIAVMNIVSDICAKYHLDIGIEFPSEEEIQKENVT